MIRSTLAVEFMVGTASSDAMASLALRVEGMRISLEAARWFADMEARRHVAVMAVALTLLGTGVLAGVAGQVTVWPSVSLGVLCLAVAATQVRARANLRRAMERNGDEAGQAVDTLMRLQEEHHVDATQGHP